MRGIGTPNSWLRWSLNWVRMLADLVPSPRRQAWLKEWESELTWMDVDGGSAVPLSSRLDLIIGALADALWMAGQDWRLDMLNADLRYAARTLGRNPGFTLVIVFVLALGIGANTVVFSVVDAVLFRPLPFPAADRLVAIWDENFEKSLVHQGPAPGNLPDWRERSQAFDGIGAWYAGEPRTVRDESSAEKVSATRVTTDFFSVFGREPQIGRTFDAGEVEREDEVVVLSHAYWTRRFAGDPGVVGSNILIDEEPHRVLGVMPADFVVPNRDVGFWLPWDFNLSYAHLPEVPRDYRFLRVVARLKSDFGIEQAQTDLDRVTSSLAGEYPTINGGWRSRLVPLDEEMVGDIRPALMLLFGAVGFVLMIACTNIANLLMARTSDRQREMALRSAIGASRLRLFRQLLTESIMLSSLGGTLGIAGAFAGLSLLVGWAPADLPRFDEIVLDARVLLFAVGLAVASGVIFGSLPALHSIRTDLSSCLKDGSQGAGTTGGRRRVRDVLVVAEIAGAMVLLTGAGLLMQSFVRILEIDPGYDRENVLVARTFPDPEKYSGADSRLGYFDQLRERLAALPGVISVGAATGLPLNEFNNTPTRPYWREGTSTLAEDAAQADVTMVTGGFFKTMRVPLVSGRDFDERDTITAAPVVIVNHALASSLWPGEEASGKYLVVDYSRRAAYPHEVVGVVGDMRTGGMRTDPRPEIFMPHRQVPYVTMNVVVRSSTDSALLVAPVRAVILDMDPTQPVHSVTTMEDLIASAVAGDRFSTYLLGVLSFLALVLAASGIYSLMAYSVSRRHHEIGVRLALGANRGNILRMVAAQGSLLTVSGIAIGIVLALGLARGMSSLLYGISAADPLTIAGVSLVLALAAAAATVVPAYRAMRVDPIQTLHHE